MYAAISSGAFQSLDKSTRRKYTYLHITCDLPRQKFNVMTFARDTSMCRNGASFSNLHFNLRFAGSTRGFCDIPCNGAERLR